MASTNRLRCLTQASGALSPTVSNAAARPSLPILATASTQHLFSTSPALAANPQKAKTAQFGQSNKGTFRVKMASAYRKPTPSKIPSTRRPEPGARKAFRKRILLSNNSALPVDALGLGNVTAATLADPASSGKMVALGDKLVDSLRVAEAFKPTQCWELFRKPHMLVRAETVELMSRMERAAAEKKAARVVVAGERISGKSMLLLQAMAHGFLNDWIVVNIPEAQDLVNASTDYCPIEGTSPLQFSQPAYITKFLASIVRANVVQLHNLKISDTPRPELANLHLSSGATLADLASSIRDQDTAWPALRVFWEELTTVPGRPPVLLTLDGLAHVMKPSAYRDPDFNVVHAHDLTLVGLFVDVLSGKRPLVNGGAVVAAMSKGNAPTVKSLDLSLALIEARKEGKEAPTKEPYGKEYDDRVEAALGNVELLRLKGISRGEARAVMDYWAASGVLRSRVTEAVVTEKWTLGGSGNLGEMERAALLNMRL